MFPVPSRVPLSRRISRVSIPAIAVALFVPDAGAQTMQPLAPVTVEAPRARARAATAAKPAASPRGTRRVARRAPRPPVTVAPTPAQQAPVATGPAPIDHDPAGGGLNPNGLNLTKVAPTGSRLGLTPMETPASVEIIPGQLARDRGQRTVQEAVSQDATGFTFIGTPGDGGTALSVRGFAGHGSVQTLFDGTRLYVGAGTVTFPYDTWSAERIEVLRGPASVLYGEGAMGGVINVIPKKPTPFFTHEGFAALGTDLSRRIAAGSGGPINDVLQYRIDAAANSAQSWLSDRTDYRNFDISGSLKFQPSANFQTTVSTDYAVNNPLRYFGTPYINYAAPDLPGGVLAPALRYTNYNVGNSLIKYQDSFTQIKTEWTPVEGLTFRNTAYRMTAARHWRDAEEYMFLPSSNLIGRDSYIEIYHGERQIGDRFDVTHKMSIGSWKNRFLVGGEVNEIHFRGANNSPYPGYSETDLLNTLPNVFDSPRPTVLGYTSRAKTGALFAEDQLSPTDWLSLIAGVRYDAPKVHREDYFAGASFDKQFRYATWHLGTVVTPLPWLAFYGQYTTGVDSVGSLLTLSRGIVKFAPARGRQIETGVKVNAWDGRVQATLAFYHILKKDLLTPDPNDPTVTQQVGAQSSRGIELSLSAWVVPDVFRLDVNAAILRAKYDDFRQTLSDGTTLVNYAGFVPTDVPQQTANIWATWRFMPEWEARVGLQYVGKSYGDYLDYVVRSRYAVLNSSLDYKWTDNVKLSVRGFNLANALYATTNYTSTQATLGQPRRVEFALNVRY